MHLHSSGSIWSSPIHMKVFFFKRQIIYTIWTNKPEEGKGEGKKKKKHFMCMRHSLYNFTQLWTELHLKICTRVSFIPPTTRQILSFYNFDPFPMYLSVVGVRSLPKKWTWWGGGLLPRATVSRPTPLHTGKRTWQWVIQEALHVPFNACSCRHSDS